MPTGRPLWPSWSPHPTSLVWSQSSVGWVSVDMYWVLKWRCVGWVQYQGVLHKCHNLWVTRGMAKELHHPVEYSWLFMFFMSHFTFVSSSLL